MAPIISLLTDFGTGDHYVGAMKGVILGICPEARIVDISHEVRAYEIHEASFTLSQAWRYFPKGSVHVVVVDPGVGSARRPIAAEAAGHVFIAPDNGVLTMVFSEVEGHRVREITADRYFRKPVSHTFHGRDIFAPCAAHIAAGVSPAKLGKRIQDYLRLSFEKPVRTARSGWTGAVLKIDRFGNLITNFPSAEFEAIETRAFYFQAGLQRVERLARNYAEAPFGELFVIAGSSGYWEISANQASAAKMLGCATGAPVELRLL